MRYYLHRHVRPVGASKFAPLKGVPLPYWTKTGIPVAISEVERESVGDGWDFPLPAGMLAISLRGNQYLLGVMGDDYGEAITFDSSWFPYRPLEREPLFLPRRIVGVLIAGGFMLGAFFELWFGALI